MKLVDPNEDFVVCTNAYKEGLGGVLMEEGHVINYDFRELKDRENNYATHDLELETIIHTLKMWKHYLIGKKYQLRTYNVSLKYIFDQSFINIR